MGDESKPEPTKEQLRRLGTLPGAPQLPAGRLGALAWPAPCCRSTCSRSASACLDVKCRHPQYLAVSSTGGVRRWTQRAGRPRCVRRSRHGPKLRGRRAKGAPSCRAVGQTRPRAAARSAWPQHLLLTCLTAVGSRTYVLVFGLLEGRARQGSGAPAGCPTGRDLCVSVRSVRGSASSTPGDRPILCCPRQACCAHAVTLPGAGPPRRLQPSR
jgi:hypothetical protein